MHRVNLSAGFSLVVCLWLISLSLGLSLVASAFIIIEFKTARGSQLRDKSQLNALMAARLALAHLQQTAGPDCRSTASGDLVLPSKLEDFKAANPYPSGTPLAAQIGQGQRFWTGVWRTDKLDEPPAWLISGKGINAITANNYWAQSLSLAGESDYDSSYWAPWQTDYPTSTQSNQLAVLVGDGSAVNELGDDGIAGTTDDKDSRIALPKIFFPYPAIEIHDDGAFAYWIGDEGIKARVNLLDNRRRTEVVADLSELNKPLRAPGRIGTELLTGLTDVAATQIELGYVTRSALPLISNYNAVDDSQPSSGLSSGKLSFHHHTFWSAGVLVDSLRGGLKRDLSLAFEMDDADFDQSDFGSGSASQSGNVTEAYTAGSINETGTERQKRRSQFLQYGPAPSTVGTINSSDPRPRVWVPMFEANADNPGRNLATDGSQYLPWAPIFIREDEMGQPLSDTAVNMGATTLSTSPSGTQRRLVGPLWHLLRDYYRLYKEVIWSGNGATLDVRAFYPNTNQFVKGGYRLHPYARYDLDNAYWSGSGSASPPYSDSYDTTPDPMGWINGRKGGDLTGHGVGRFIPRAVRGAYMPTVHRLSLIFSLKTINYGSDYTLKLVCSPLLVLHNPYNVSLKLKRPTSPEPDGRIQGAGRVAFSQFDQLRLQIFTHPYPTNDTRTAYNTSATSRLLNTLYGFSSASDASTGSNAENLAALIPADTLEPGEFAVYSCKETIDVNGTQLERALDGTNIPIINFSKGLWLTGGFYTDIRDSSVAVAPFKFSGTDVIKACLSLTGAMYWQHWIYFNSGWKKNLYDDRVSAEGDDLGSDEIIGTTRNNSRASYAHYINVGGNNFNAANLGDAGSPTNPVLIGPVSTIRKISESAPGPILGVFDTRARTADASRNNSHNRSLLSWQAAQADPIPAPHPVWLFSNPLPQTSSNPALSGLPGIGMASQCTHLWGGDELYLNGSATSWGSIIQTDPVAANGAKALGGNSHGASGVNQTTEVEIPLSPPVSLGQLMHANLSVWDWFPYRTVGNSFPSLVVPLDKAWTHGTPHNSAPYTGGNTFPDMSYLMNQALWDGFYFSGAAPTLKSIRDGNYNSIRKQSMQEVLNAYGVGEQRLANSRLRIFQPSGIDPFTIACAQPGFCTPSNTGKTPIGYQQLAGYLLNDGGFNVNSTSVEAWTGLYAALKGIALGSYSAQQPAQNNNARYPRVLSLSQSNITTADTRASSYWNGFVNLSDEQIKALAVATVSEIKARTQFLQRTEHDQEYPPTARRFRGFSSDQNPATPFLSLSEFINRFLGPTKKAGARVNNNSSYHTSLYPLPNATTNSGGDTGTPYAPLPGDAEKVKWMFRSGTIESAIARADKTLGANGLAQKPAGGFMINPSVSYNWNYGNVAGGRTSMPPGIFFRNIETLDPDNQNRTHNGFGANGCFFQGDILQALGPMLATRSDTFVIRAYGETESSAHGTASAVLELIVQRTPEYMNPEMKPHERLQDQTAGPAKTINTLLGRRFIVVSARWLDKSEI